MTRWQRNPHWIWWVAGGVLALGVTVAVGGYYVYTRHLWKPGHDDRGYPEKVSCDRHHGHRICVWKFPYGNGYAYTINQGSLSEETYGTPVEAAAAARIFVAFLSGDIKHAEPRDDNDTEAA